MTYKNKKLLLVNLIIIVVIIAAVFTGCTVPKSTSFVITFETDGGDIIAPRTVTTDDTSFSLPTPKKSGFEFDGWFKDSNLSEAFDGIDKLTSDITLYAKWKSASFSVAFYDEYGKKLYEYEVPQNTKFSKSIPDVPKKEGYSGVWQNIEILDSEITGDVEIFAQYSLSDVNIYFLVKIDDKDHDYAYKEIDNVEFENYLIFENQTGQPDTSIEKMSLQPQKTNYYFVGWYYDTAHKQPCLDIPDIIPKKNTVLYAYFVDISEMGKMFTYRESDGNLTITGLTSDGKLKSSLVIPEKINDKNVTAIGELSSSGKKASDMAIFESQYLSSIIVPSTVKSIGSFAFLNCPSLTSVTLNGGIEEIGIGAFAGCTKLRRVILPASVITINDYAFAGITLSPAKGQEKIDFGVTSDDWRTEENWYLADMDLEIFEIPENSALNNLKSHIFYNTANLKTLDIPNTITTVTHTIFDGKRLKLYDGNKELIIINDAVYSKDQKILYYYPVNSDYNNNGFTLSDNTEMIAQYAFYNSGIKTITSNENLKNIGKFAFYSCTELTKIDFSNSKLTTIGDFAFADSTVSKIIFPDTTASIGSYTFNNCKSLEEVIFSDSIISEIKPFTFNSCTNLETINLPNSVKVIGENAFNNCTSLANVLFEEGSTLEFINDYAFYNTISLNPITVSSTITKIGSFAFAASSNNYNTAGITFGDMPNLAFIGDYAFLNNSGLTTVQLPSSLSYLGKGAFKNAIRINSLLLSNISITGLPDEIFYGCTGIAKQIILSTSLKDIGNYAFYGCEKLPSVKFNNITSIGDYAFYGCISLTEGTDAESGILPSKLTKLGISSFYGCQSITTIDIPSGMSYISENAFYNCTGLTQIRINSDSNVNVIEKNAFGYCTNLEVFDIPASLGTRDDESGFIGNPFIGCDKLISFTSLAGNNNGIVAKEDGILYFEAEVVADIQTYEIYAFPTGKSGSVDIATNITKIQPFAFYGSNIDKLSFKTNTVSNNKLAFFLAEIGDYAFAESKSLTEIDLSARVVKTGIGSFFNDSALNTIRIDTSEIQDGMSVPGEPTAKYHILNSTVSDNNKLSLGESSFENCAVTSLSIPSRVIYIGDKAFKNCYSVLDITFLTSSFNDDITIGDYAFNNNSGLTELILPYTLSKIGDYAFSWCVNITDIRFGYTEGKELTIGDYAFNNCNYLYQITFPSSLKSFGEGIFSQNTRLKYVNFAASTNNITLEIPSYAFVDASSLEEITIPSYVSKIGNYAFNNINLNSIIINNADSELIIGDYALSGLNNLSSLSTERELKLGKYALYNTPIKTFDATVLSIDDHAFQNTDIISITIKPEMFKNGEEIIGTGCFADTKFLKTIVFDTNSNLSNITIPDSCFENSNIESIVLENTPDNLIIGNNAFRNTLYLKKINLGFSENKDEGVWIKAKAKLEIGKNAFYNNVTKATEIHSENGSVIINEFAFSKMPITNSVKIFAATIDIDKFAFGYLDSLTSLELNAGNITIAAGFSAYSKVLKEIIIDDESGIYKSFDNVVYKTDENILISYPAGKKGSTYEIKEGTEKIADYAFSGCEKIANLILPEDFVVSKTENSFDNSNDIKLFVPDEQVTEYINIWQTNNVTYINESLDNLLLKKLSNENYSIEKYTGVDTEITLKHIMTDGSGNKYVITEIEASAFRNNAVLQNLTIESGIREIGEYAFSDCLALTTVNMQNISDIGRYAFRGCTKLEKIQFSYNLAEISAFAFAYCESLENVALPENLLSIGNSAFYMCTKLTDVTMFDKLTKIDANAFNGCNKLMSITIPENVEQIGGYAFANCEELTFIYLNSIAVPQIKATTFLNTNHSKTLLIPEKLKVPFSSAIYWNEFALNMYCNENIYQENGKYYVLHKLDTADAYELAAILDNSYTSIPHIIDGKKVTSVGKNAINHYAIDITLEEGYQTLKANAFAFAYDIERVTLPSTISDIGNKAFYGCTALKSVTIQGDSHLTTIGDYAFYDTCLTSFYIPRKVSSIGNYAFGADTKDGLSEISFGFNNNDGVSISIGSYAFINNIKLREVVFNGEVAFFGEGAFNNCASLNKIEFNSVINAPKVSSSNSLFDGCTSLSLFVPNTASKQKFLNTWKNNADKNKLVVSDFLYRDPNNSVKYIKGENGKQQTVTTKNYFVFSPIEGTNNVEIINYIGDYCGDYIDYKNTADGAPRDSDIVIPSSFVVSNVTYYVTRIGSYAFNNIITSVVIPDSVNTIASYAFYKASSLENITFGSQSQLTTIGTKAFAECPLINDIIIPKGVSEIGESAFANCDSLTGIVFRARLDTDTDTDLLKIQKMAFYDCDNLTQITLPKHYISLGDYIFGSCDKLSDITLLYKENGSDQTIGSYAFENTALKAVHFPETVRTIGDYAFNNCDSLSAVYLSRTVNLTRTYSNIFNNIENHFVRVYVPNSVFSSYKNNEGWQTKTVLPNLVDDSGLYNYVLSANSATITSFLSQDKVITVPEKITVTTGGKTFNYSVVSIASFAGNSNIEEISFALNSKVVRIEKYAFAYCESLKKIHLPDSVNSIESYAFTHCEKLTDLVLPSLLAKIENRTFTYCTALKEITIPQGITAIDEASFSGCSSLNRIIVKASALIVLGSGAFDNTSKHLTIVVPTEHKANYRNEWVNYAERIFGQDEMYGDYVYVISGNDIIIKQYNGYKTLLDKELLNSILIKNKKITVFDQNACVNEDTVIELGE